MARYWFRQKRFGYGATPNTWQGWVFTLAGVLLMMGIALGVGHIANGTTRVVMTIAGEIVVLAPFTWISYVKTEGGWRWRS